MVVLAKEDIMVGLSVIGGAVFGLACVPSDTLDQMLLAVPYQVESSSCAGCRIELEKLVTLGSPGGDGGLPEIPGTITVDGRGRYYVIPDRIDEMPALYSPAGEFLTRIGSPGEGPGELVNPSDIWVGAGDSVHVFDFNLARISVFGPDHEYVRSYAMKWPQAGMTMLESGNLAINGPIPTSDRIGFALHTLDTDGDLALSFDEFVASSREATWMRSIGTGPSGLWSVSYGWEHTLRLFNPDSGELIREIKRESEWYPPVRKWLPAAPDQPPMPLILGIWEDQEGIVWTIGWVAAADWSDHLQQPVETDEGTLYVFDRNQGYDGVIEAVDVATGDLAASVKTSAPPWQIVAPGIIAFFKEDSVGWWYADLYRLRLHRP